MAVRCIHTDLDVYLWLYTFWSVHLTISSGMLVKGPGFVKVWPPASVARRSVGLVEDTSLRLLHHRQSLVNPQRF